jgi:aspartate/glutamate racemase
MFGLIKVNPTRESAPQLIGIISGSTWESARYYIREVVRKSGCEFKDNVIICSPVAYVYVVDVVDINPQELR